MRSGENGSVVVRWCAVALGGGLLVAVGVWCGSERFGDVGAAGDGPW
jgi:hypothetical protein